MARSLEGSDVLIDRSATGCSSVLDAASGARGDPEATSECGGPESLQFVPQVPNDVCMLDDQTPLVEVIYSVELGIDDWRSPSHTLDELGLDDDLIDRFRAGWSGVLLGSLFQGSESRSPTRRSGPW